MLKALLEYLVAAFWMSRVPLMFMAGGALWARSWCAPRSRPLTGTRSWRGPASEAPTACRRRASAGLGVAGVVYLVLAVIRFARPNHLSGWETAVFVGGAFALIGGLMDDILDLNARWKFLFQFAAAGSAVILGATPGWARLVGKPRGWVRCSTRARRSCSSFS